MTDEARKIVAGLTKAQRMAALDAGPLMEGATRHYFADYTDGNRLVGSLAEQGLVTYSLFGAYLNRKGLAVRTLLQSETGNG